MSTYTTLPFGVSSYFGDSDANTVVATGTRSENQSELPKLFAYTYGVYGIWTFGGNDTVYLTDLTAIDPAGVLPRARQYVDAGEGADFVFVTSLTAATLIGGDGDDVLWKTDLRGSSTNPVENGAISVPPIVFTADGLTQDAAWLDFNIFDGGMGNDTITAGNANDWAYGGDGNDTMSLGSGINVAFGGTGNDTFIVEGLAFNRATSGLPPTSQSTYAFGTNAIWAGDGDDVVSIRWVQNGAGLSSAVNGEAGNDMITISSISPSWVTGGSGNDTITITDLFLRYSYGSSFSEANDTVFAGDDNDVVYSGNGNDTLVGGNGHDWLFGQFGSDFLYGHDGAVADNQSDRFSFGNYRHQDFSQTATFFTEDDHDTIFGFQPASSFGDATGKSDKIDLAQLINDNSFLTYDAGNPFLQGELRLMDQAGGAVVQASDGAGGWISFLTIYGVFAADLDIVNQADLSGGLSSATGGDFLWFTG